jgi:hypothetical protein
MNVLYSYGSINLAIEVGINVVKQCAKNKIHVHPQEKSEETTSATNPNPNEKVKMEMNRSNMTTQ